MHGGPHQEIRAENGGPAVSRVRMAAFLCTKPHGGWEDMHDGSHPAADPQTRVRPALADPGGHARAIRGSAETGDAVHGFDAVEDPLRVERG